RRSGPRRQRQRRSRSRTSSTKRKTFPGNESRFLLRKPRRQQFGGGATGGVRSSRVAEQIIDLSSEANKRRVIGMIRNATGLQRVLLTRWRPKASNRQRAYYIAVHGPMLAVYLTEQGQPTTKEEAHELFKFRFRMREKIDPATGKVLRYVGSTSK